MYQYLIRMNFTTLNNMNFTTLNKTFYEKGLSNLILAYKSEFERYEFEQKLKKLFFYELMNGCDQIDGNIKMEVLQSLLMPSTFFKFPYLMDYGFTSSNHYRYSQILSVIEQNFIKHCELYCIDNTYRTLSGGKKQVYEICFDGYMTFNFIYYDKYYDGDIVLIYLD